MPLVFVIPGALKEFAGDRSEVRIAGEAASAGDALALLWRECPGARDRVLTELGVVRPHINVFVNGENIRHAGGLAAPVPANAEIVIVPAVSGGESDRRRCTWARTPLSIAYHDREWGVSVHDDRVFFEFVTLEGAQAGLSWETILKKRDAYREAFAGFDPVRVARFTPARVERLLRNEGIVRHRLKVASTVGNAKAFLAIQKEFGSFDAYVWRFVNGAPLVNGRATLNDVPARTAESDALSHDLLKRGFKFVGSTICYAFMQATGLVNDHTTDCFRYANRSTRTLSKVRGEASLPQSQPELRLRINVLDPLKDVRMQLQSGRSDLVSTARESRRALHFDFSVRVGKRPDGRPNFLGPFTQGPPGERFVYVNSGTLAGQPESCWTRRAKVPLTSVTWALIDAARRADAPLETDMPGIGGDGGPTCATVKGVAWRVRTA
ncbi:MAG: DNA-3-methyladenine glycosylase I [Acidobacteria bacterium]|nr:DNA-3-methyladenine glycosylase I [Acidobacteriota bacterium]